jgi:hypothetical protein
VKNFCTQWVGYVPQSQDIICRMNDQHTLPSTTEPCSLGVFHLKRLWAKTLAKQRGELPHAALSEEYPTDVALMAAVGIGIEPALIYLYRYTPTLQEFESWVMSQNRGKFNAASIRQFNAAFDRSQVLPHVSALSQRILTDADLAHWEREGYLIIRKAVSREDAQAAEQAVWDFLEMDSNDSSTWYKHHPAQQGIMVQLFHHKALETTRTSPRIRQVFEDLWGSSNILGNTDRVSFNPPETDIFSFPGPRLHWDVSLELPIPLGLQGILYLTDVSADQGALKLVPGFQHRISSWLASLPREANPRVQDFDALGAIPIAANAGDLIVWHQALPHGSSPNRAHYPRIAQYVCYQPVVVQMQKSWK